MPLAGKALDDLILSERSDIYKSLLEEKPLNIETDKEDEKVLNDMEEESIWLKRLPSKKILD